MVRIFNNDTCLRNFFCHGTTDLRDKCSSGRPKQVKICKQTALFFSFKLRYVQKPVLFFEEASSTSSEEMEATTAFCIILCSVLRISWF